MMTKERRTQPIPTLADIALRVGVTKATVSLALRGDVRISAGTRLRVEKAALALNYRPDPMLAALSARRGGRRALANLALLIDGRWGKAGKRPKWMRNCLDGLLVAASQFGYAISEFSPAEDLAGKAAPDRIFAARGIRGIVIFPFFGERPAMPALNWAQYAVVTIGNLMPEMGWHRVGTDAFAAMSLVCERLRERGVTRIGLAQHLDTECRGRHEWLGALTKEWHLGGRFETVAPLLDPLGSEEAFLRWYRRERPEVVVSNNERVIDWLEAAGVGIPEETGVVLLNRDSARRANVAGIVQHFDEVGGAAAELIHGLALRGLRGTPAVRRETLVAPHWADGATLRPALRSV